MTPHRNPRGHVALLVDATLYLPNGRPVPFAEVTGWEEADDDAVPTPACLAAAVAAQRVLDARPVVTVARVLPVLDAPKPWVEAPEGARFRARCEAARGEIAARLQDGPGRARYLDVLSGMIDASRHIAPTTAMYDALEAIEACWDGVVLAEIKAQAEVVAAYVGEDKERAFLRRNAVSMLARIARGWVAKGRREVWAGYWRRWGACK